MPELTGKPSGEFGHPNYQHPHRSPRDAGGNTLPQGIGYGPAMDRFALLVVYTALRALAFDGKSLWRAFDCGENLLFRDADFREPTESWLFKRLWSDFGRDVRALAARVLFASQGPIEDVPALAELVEGNKVGPLTRARGGARCADAEYSRGTVAPTPAGEGNGHASGLAPADPAAGRKKGTVPLSSRRQSPCTGRRRPGAQDESLSIP